MPVTVAAQVAVCAVEMAAGEAATVTPVTVGCTGVVETATTAVPNFAESCTEVALMVTEVGAVEGAV